MLHQLQAKDEALEKLQHNHLEVKGDSSISYTFHDDDFVSFEKHTTGIRSKLLKKMGYQGKSLSINEQGTIKPIKVEELPCHARLGYVMKEVREFSKTNSGPPTTDDESTSSHPSDSEGSMSTYQRHIRRKRSKTIQKGWRRTNRCSYRNEVGHQQAMSQMFQAQKASIEEPKGENVQ